MRKTSLPFGMLLSFNGNCREAFTFYQHCFGGKLLLQTMLMVLTPDPRIEGREISLSPLLSVERCAMVFSTTPRIKPFACDYAAWLLTRGLPVNYDFLYLAKMKDRFFAVLNSISPLSTETLADIDASLAAAHYPAHTILVRDGQLSDKMFFILNGVLRAYYIHEDREYTDWFMFENMFACSLSAFFGSAPSPQCIETLEATDALIITRKQLESICNRHHDMSLLNGRILSQSLVTLQTGFIDQRFKTAPERYALLLEHYPEVIRRVPLKYIASYLGVSQETLSRIRARK